MAADRPPQTDLRHGGLIPHASSDAARSSANKCSGHSSFAWNWLRWPRTPFERQHFSFRASMVVHAMLMICLGLWYAPIRRSTIGIDFTAGWQAEGTSYAVQDATGELVAPLADDAPQAKAIEAPSPLLEAISAIDRPQIEVILPIEAPVGASQSPSVPGSIAGGDLTLSGGVGIPGGGGFEGRGQRGTLGFRRGATPQSEAAVERGLNWLLAHQFKDGSWRFDHTLDGGACNGYCRNAGTNGSSTGSTAMALLAFYGAGYTHVKGPYQKPLNDALYYLGRRMLLTPNGGDLQEGTMYAQGLGTIALCEAYAMSGDESLRPLAEQAIKFVLYAQDKKGGGWRYSPGEPGDTTVHGWQLMALKSASLAGISVPSPAWHMAGEFLDSVQTDGGAAYGYRTPKRLETTTSVGLLCRMYMGWPRDQQALVRGVAYLDKTGPSKSNMYYNYYATQVMHHYGGEPWKRWNGKMRDYLIGTQARVGHEAGSWHFDDQHGNAGGRLYNTAMAIMTLEVYYRYMPLYGDRAVTESF